MMRRAAGGMEDMEEKENIFKKGKERFSVCMFIVPRLDRYREDKV